MTLEKFGEIWCLDHCLAVASCNLLNEKEIKNCFNWIKLRPIYIKDKTIRGKKIDMRLNLLQEKKGNIF